MAEVVQRLSPATEASEEELTAAVEAVARPRDLDTDLDSGTHC